MAESLRLAIPEGWEAEIEWDVLREDIQRYVGSKLGRHANPDDVEEMTQECLARLVDGRTPMWDPEEAPVFVFACGIVLGLIRNASRRKKRRTRYANAKRAEYEQSVGQGAQLTDTVVEGREAIAWLEERVSADADVSALLRSTLQGRSRYPDCRSLGMSPHRFDLARRRLKCHVEKMNRLLRRERR